MKRGISLIAVLMFMLAATTGSVVLFKWLGSENFASGSRLKFSEAYQASESGLDAVKAWLSFKAADVGMVLSDHLSGTNSIKSPYLLNSVLGEGENNGKFKVYLIAADTVSKPYKLKFMSVGTGRDGSQVKQTAIFSVDGLYNIDVPASMTMRTPNPTDFNEDFWGNMGTAHSIESMRAVLTQSPSIRGAGGQMFNYMKIGTIDSAGYLVLDGNYYVNHGINVYGDVYSTGDFDFCPSGNGDFITGNLYVEGVFHPKGALRIDGDGFFKGGINPNLNINDAGTGSGGCTGTANGGVVVVGGNSTIQNNFVYWNNGGGGGLGFHVANNLVMDAGNLVLTRTNNNASSDSLSAYGNVYIANPITGTVPDANRKPIPFFGNNSNRTVCISGAVSDGTQNAPFYWTEITNTCSKSCVHVPNEVPFGASTCKRNCKDVVKYSGTTCTSCDWWTAEFAGPTCTLPSGDKVLVGSCNSNAKDCEYSPNWTTAIQDDNVPNCGATVCDISNGTQILQNIAPNSCIKFRTNSTVVNKTPCPNPSSIEGADPLDGTKSDKDLKAKLEQGGSELSCENTPIKFDTSIYRFVKSQNPPYWVHRTDLPRSCGTSGSNSVLKFEVGYQALGTALQDCWNNTTSTAFYKNEWLVIYIRDQVEFENLPGKLTNGKYIIIFDYISKTPSNSNRMYLPSTGDAQVMLYFPNGYASRIELAGDTGTTAKYNYFIFSDGNIGQFNTTGNRKLTGNIFMNECSIMNSQTAEGSGYLRSHSNMSFVNELMSAGILEKNEAFVGGSSSSNHSASSTVTTKQDDYIIPLSPRLKVQLESKYISKETEPQAGAQPANWKSVNDFTLVMPRVLRLPPTAFPVGVTVRNYYNLLHVNGAVKPVNDPSYVCRNNETNDMINEASPAQGVYTCSFNNAKISDFYLKIENTATIPGSGGGSPDFPAEISSSSNQSSSSQSSSSNLPYSSSEDITSIPPTITCTLAKTSVTQGENIPPPIILCSSGDLNKSNATFTAAGLGVLPTYFDNWKNTSGNMNAYYNNSATAIGTTGNVISVSDVTCGGATPSNLPMVCGTILVNKPTCTLGSISYTVNATITPNVSCGSATLGGHISFDGTNWTNTTNMNNTSGKFTSVDNNRTLSVTSITCDDHPIAYTSGTLACTPNVNIVAASSSSTATCTWAGSGKTMSSGAAKPADPVITCSSGAQSEAASLTWTNNNEPTNPLTSGTYTPVPTGVTCGGNAIGNASSISCGTLTVN